MSRNGYTGPKLPKSLLDQVQNGHGSKNSRQNVSRKDRRKAERQQKKQRPQRQMPAPKKHVRQLQQDGEEDEDNIDEDNIDEDNIDEDNIDEDNIDEGDEESESETSSAPPPKPAKESKPLKSILKKEEKETPASKPAASESETEVEESTPIISSHTKRQLQDDEDEIAALEKKLGMKGKKSKALEGDGLDWLMGGSDSSDEDGSASLKRKRSEDTKWLRDKRMKASGIDETVESSAEDSEGSEEDDKEVQMIENPFSDDEMDGDDFEGFESEDDSKVEAQAPPKKRKENPYVPPVANGSTTKYVPPSLRATAASDEEVLKQLRRQIQGLLNRLSESNFISILQSLEEIYGKNARQHVTSTLVDLLVGLVADPAILNDSFLILHAAFSAAVYKVVGTDFGAQLLEKVVEKFEESWSRDEQEGKQALNLLGFLCNLYTFQVIGSSIVFDYIRMLLDELSENNTELLLRVIRTCGQSLRQDDPSALKDIVLLLQRSVTKIGESNVSVRTKFMIETINDLKNNRMKAAGTSTLATEQTPRMKKTLSSLNTSRSIKARESIRITLADIKDSDKKGKWWLVGASYHDPAKLASPSSMSESKNNRVQPEDDGYESETPGKPNLSKLARSEGMNNPVRRAIFINLLSAVDYIDAHSRILKLHLRNKQRLEIPPVIVHCAGGEEAYNPYYALVAGKFCGEGKLRDVRKGFEFALWDFFRKIDGTADDDDSNEPVGVRKIVNLAKFYGTLIAEGRMSLRVLTKLDLAYPGSNSSMFAEVAFTTIFDQIRQRQKKASKEGTFEEAVKATFMQAAGYPEFIQGLSEILKGSVSRAELVNRKKEKRAVERGCEVALDALFEASKTTLAHQDDGSSEDDM